MNAARPPKRKRRSRAVPASRKVAAEIDVIVGRNVRIRRMAKGLSQSQLAKRLGVTFQQVQKYEKGTNRIGASRLARIAQMVEVPLSLLLGEADVEPEVLGRLALIANRRALRLAQAFAAIEHAPTRLAIVELVEGLAAADARRRRG